MIFNKNLKHITSNLCYNLSAYSTPKNHIDGDVYTGKETVKCIASEFR